MDGLKLCDSEYRFMLLVWESSPVRSGGAVRLAADRLGWKKSTTYTVIRKLAERGFLKNEDALVTPLVSKDACQAVESDYFVERTFGGSLPKFLAAFLGDKKISEEEAEEIRRLIDFTQGGVSMAWIREVFLTILNMSVTAGITILVILAVRAVFRKAPRKYLYVLWLVAAFRLVCPWAPESGVSLFNLTLLQPAESAGGVQVWYAPAEAGISGGDTGEAAAGGGQSPGAAAGSPDSEGIQQAEGTGNGSGTAGTASSYEPQAQGSQSLQQAAGHQNRPQEDQAQQNSSAATAGQETVRKMFPGGFTVLCRVWLIGIAVSLLYQIPCWRKVRRVTCQAVLLEENIYECGSIGSPFVMGIRKPKIYIPFRLTAESG